MRARDSRNGSFAEVLQSILERSNAPLSVAGQRQRYRRRRKLPDWAWGVIVGLTVSLTIAGVLIFNQAR